MCKITNCNKVEFTSDGYCIDHKNFTTTDFQIIYEFIRDSIDKLNPITSKKRLKKFIRLVKYLLYREDFLYENEGVLNVIANKIDYFFIKFNSTDVLDKELEDKIIELYIEINYMMDKLL